MRKLLLPAFAAVLLAACAPAAPDPTIDAGKLKAHIEVLASDDYEGRGVNTPGEVKTVDYITTQFKAAGLEPGGDKLPDGTRAWTQDVTLASFRIEGPRAISAATPKGAQPLIPGKDISVRASASGLDQVDLKNVPIVFAGYGVTAPEKAWDDFAGVDVKGKVILVLVNDPDFETGSGDFGGKAMTYYGRWTYKYEEAARRGAAGVLVIHETAPAAYPWGVIGGSDTETLFDIVRDNPAKDHAALEGWIQRDAAVSLFAAAGLDFDTLKKAAQQKGFMATPLNGVTLSANYKVVGEKIVTKNVVGLLPGTKRPDETVIYTSHWDHLGKGAADKDGDDIYNGAVDNADGIAVLIELGRAFAAAPRTERSMVFLAVTAEESGLLGSAYYASKPLYPLEKTVGILNMDALMPSGAAKDFSLAGDAPLTLQDDLIAVAKARGRAFTPDPTPEAGHFYRSDHFSFAKVGVPAISFGSGQDLTDGGRAAGDAFEKAYVADRYHQPSDELTADWKFEGIVEDAVLLYALGRQLADSGAWPQWKEGSEFKATRDQTAAARK